MNGYLKFLRVNSFFLVLGGFGAFWDKVLTYVCYASCSVRETDPTAVWLTAHFGEAWSMTALFFIDLLFLFMLAYGSYRVGKAMKDEPDTWLLRVYILLPLIGGVVVMWSAVINNLIVFTSIGVIP